MSLTKEGTLTARLTALTPIPRPAWLDAPDLAADTIRTWHRDRVAAGARP